MTAVSRHVAELVNLLNSADPMSALGVRPQGRVAHLGARQGRGVSYEHVDPALVGNSTRILVSDLGGRTGMALKARELGIELDERAAAELTERLKRLEAEGYQFEAADASLELLMREATGWTQPFFRLEGYRVTTYHRNALRSGAPIEDGEAIIDTEASVKIWVGDTRSVAIGEGNGPVNALDQALRSVLSEHYPQLRRVHLTDFKVRVIEGSGDTGAVVRVLIDSTDGDRTWSTVGVDTNVIEASWQALVDPWSTASCTRPRRLSRSLGRRDFRAGAARQPAAVAAPEYVPSHRSGTCAATSRAPAAGGGSPTGRASSTAGSGGASASARPGRTRATSTCSPAASATG